MSNRGGQPMSNESNDAMDEREALRAGIAAFDRHLRLEEALRRIVREIDKAGTASLDLVSRIAREALGQ